MISIEEEPDGEDEWICKVCSTVNFGGDECSKCTAARPTTALSVIAQVLMAIVIAIGFIKKVNLISGLLQKMMGKNTATPTLAGTSGILSWVSSTTGVVMPAMFKMLPDIMRNFSSSVNDMEMISAITATSFAAAISPLSTGGAIIMSSYSASKETTNEELNKIFKFLFLLSVGNVLLNVCLTAIRLFSFYGLFG